MRLTVWTVMLRGIRYRAGRSAVVFLLALLATTAAVLAPAYSRAAQQSVLTDGLRSAPADARTLVVGAKGTSSESQAAFQDTADIRVAVRQVLNTKPAVGERVERPTSAVDTEATVTSRQDPLVTRFAYRDDACVHLKLTGACPTDAGQVLVSERSAKAHGFTAGERVTLRLGNRTAGRDHAFQVVGLYTPKDPTEAYWGRTVYFAGGADPTAEAERLDAIFTGAPADVRLERTAALSTRLEYPLDTDSVGLDDVAALRDGLKTIGNRLRADDLELTTGLPSILDDVAADRAAIARTAPIIAVPLLLLCWFVLFLLVASLVEERAPEIALAKLRGYPTGRATRFGLGEALLLIAAAAPAGLVAGVALVELAARSVLATGTHAELRWPAVAAAAVALLAAVAAALLAGRGTVRRPVLALLRRVPARTRWQAGLAEGIVVALAAASLVAAVGDRSAPLALLAPPLLALVAGIATARLLGIWARVRLSGARRRGRLVTLLSSAQLSRRPAGQRLVVVVTVAVALLSFAATAWDVAAQARRDHAADALGADRVYTVAADHPATLLGAVTKADPGGHAMAVVRTTQRYGDSSVELLGVQSPRLAAVARWRDHDRGALTRLAGRLHPNVAAPLPLAGDVTVQGRRRRAAGQAGAAVVGRRRGARPAAAHRRPGPARQGRPGLHRRAAAGLRVRLPAPRRHGRPPGAGHPHSDGTGSAERPGTVPAAFDAPGRWGALRVHRSGPARTAW
jgi:hypothetical protein